MATQEPSKEGLAQNTVTQNTPNMWEYRLEDYRRHVQDLVTKSYEGSRSREEREEVFRSAFNFVTPVAGRVLDDLNRWFLDGTGEVTVQPPARDSEGGLVGAWNISWPLLRKASNRFNGEPLDPLSITAIFPLTPSLGMSWTHPHLALLLRNLPGVIAAAWPFQVLCAEDAERQEPILRVLAEAELHERTFLADLNWRILPHFFSTAHENH